MDRVVAGEVSTHVSTEHERLRVLLADLVRESLQTGRKVGHRELRERLALLRSAAERAIAVEENELIPLLETTTSTTGVVARLRDRHARVLAALDDFEADVAAGHHHCDLVSRAEDVVAAFSSELDGMPAAG